jgi:hypothetical protein
VPASVRRNDVPAIARWLFAASREGPVLREEHAMKSRSTFGPTLALAAIAAGFGAAVLAQSTVDTAADTSAQTTVTVTTPSSIDPNATIGSTGLTRADSANAAFGKLDPQSRGFLSRSDLRQLPDFGNAFAQADRDADGRLDRTEFTDAWSYYVDQGASAGETTTVTLSQ